MYAMTLIAVTDVNFQEHRGKFVVSRTVIIQFNLGKLSKYQHMQYVGKLPVVLKAKYSYNAMYIIMTI